MTDEPEVNLAEATVVVADASVAAVDAGDAPAQIEAAQALADYDSSLIDNTIHQDVINAQPEVAAVAYPTVAVAQAEVTAGT